MLEPWVATREAVERLRARLEEFPAMAVQMGMATDAGFWARVQDRHAIFFELPPDAFFAALDVRPGDDATVFFVAWDHHLVGKEARFREALGWCFQHARLRRVTLVTPASSTVILKLAKRLGFQWEGVLRDGWRWGSVVEDLHVNGLLRREYAADEHHAAA